MICMYCEKEESEMYTVRQAAKPKSQPNRWKEIGRCCESCEQAGKPTAIEYAQSNQSTGKSND